MGTFFSFVVIAIVAIFALAAFANAVRVFVGGESKDDPHARKEALMFALIALALAIAVFCCFFGKELFWRVFR